MDHHAAKELHAALWKRLRSRPSVWDRLWWIPAISASAYFAFDGFAGAFLGALVGWAVCAVMIRFDTLETKMIELELLRLLHEHTDEAADGKALSEMQRSLEESSARWWR